MMTFYFNYNDLDNFFEDINISEKIRNSVGYKTHTTDELRTLINDILKEEEDD